MSYTRQDAAIGRMCLAVDTPNVAAAEGLAGQVGDLFGYLKIGKQLHTAAGSQGVNIVQKFHERGQKGLPNVFLDLKLHDTPDTVYAASVACAVPGVYMFNLHVAGGEKMCREALRGAHEGAEALGISRPKVIGVTVLTSLNDADLAKQGLNVRYDDLVMRRTELAREWGLDGIVCPANMAGELEKRFGQWLYVTPGIQYAGKQNPGQKQLTTPELAVQQCQSSVLVIGSAVTKAEDKRAVALEIIESMVPYMKAL